MVPGYLPTMVCTPSSRLPGTPHQPPAHLRTSAPLAGMSPYRANPWGCRTGFQARGCYRSRFTVGLHLEHHLFHCWVEKGGIRRPRGGRRECEDNSAQSAHLPSTTRFTVGHCSFCPSLSRSWGYSRGFEQFFAFRINVGKMRNGENLSFRNIPD